MVIEDECAGLRRPPLRNRCCERDPRPRRQRLEPERLELRLGRRHQLLPDRDEDERRDCQHDDDRDPTLGRRSAEAPVLADEPALAHATAESSRSPTSTSTILRLACPSP